MTLGIFIIDANNARRESSRVRCGQVVGLFPVQDVKDPLGYGGATYLAIPARGTMLVHAEADRIVQNRSLPVELDETPYRLPEDLRRVAPLAIRTLRSSGKVIWNGPALAMMDDLLPASEGVARPVRLRQTGYFMGICSSELCQYWLIDQETGEETDLRLKHLVELSGRLVTLASSDMANIVGISTLAFTTDDYLLMGRQSARNAASGKLLAPSGSGSLEPRDLAGARVGTTASNAERRTGPSGHWARADMAATSLQEVLRLGMERELAEETGVSADKILGTRVLGFGRWLERGARPEFFGVTSLNIASDHPSIARIKSSEAVFSEGVRPDYVDLAQLRQELARDTLWRTRQAARSACASLGLCRSSSGSGQWHSTDEKCRTISALATKPLPISPRDDAHRCGDGTHCGVVGRAVTASSIHSAGLGSTSSIAPGRSCAARIVLLVERFSMFSIDEAVTVSGDNPMNEDTLGWTLSSAWVVDGATPLGEPYTVGGLSSATWFAAQISDSFRTLPAETGAVMTAAEVITRTQTQAARQLIAAGLAGRRTRHLRPRPTLQLSTT